MLLYYSILFKARHDELIPDLNNLHSHKSINDLCQPSLLRRRLPYQDILVLNDSNPVEVAQLNSLVCSPGAFIGQEHPKLGQNIPHPRIGNSTQLNPIEEICDQNKLND